MSRILIVEDDFVIAEMIAKGLRQWGFDAHIADDFQNVVATFHEYDPHLILMDISLPYYNGYYWCTEIRKVSKVPIIFLSSRADKMDIIMAINMGGDDYISKPISMDLLTSKIQAMLRRSYDYVVEPPQLRFRGYSLNSGISSLCFEEEKIELTKNEFRILQTLLENKGQIVSREKLMLKLWDSDEFIDDNTLTVNVNRLRKTLKDYGFNDCIVTHKGQGYSIHE